MLQTVFEILTLIGWLSELEKEPIIIWASWNKKYEYIFLIIDQSPKVFRIQS